MRHAEGQEEVLGKRNKKSHDILEQDNRVKQRIQFRIPTRKSKKLALMNVMNQSKVRRSMIGSGLTQNNVELVRRANALNVAADNMFRTTAEKPNLGAPAREFAPRFVEGGERV